AAFSGPPWFFLSATSSPVKPVLDRKTAFSVSFLKMPLSHGRSSLFSAFGFPSCFTPPVNNLSIQGFSISISPQCEIFFIIQSILTRCRCRCSPSRKKALYFHFTRPCEMIRGNEGCLNLYIFFSWGGRIHYGKSHKIDRCGVCRGGCC